MAGQRGLPVARLLAARDATESDTVTASVLRVLEVTAAEMGNPRTARDHCLSQSDHLASALAAR